MIDNVVVIGARGRVGSAVSARLRERGVVVRDPEDTDAADLVLLCVPDRAIAEVAAAIDVGPWVAHTSGGTGLSALAPHTRRFGVHPLQTFNKSGRASQFDGAWAAATGETDDARARARWLASALGLTPFDLAEADRALYHAGAAIASNYLVTLYRAARRACDAAGVPPEALVPTLELDDGTRLNQSLAIIEFLEEKHPNPALLPKDALARSRVRSLSYLIASEIHPLNNLRVLQHLKGALGQSQEQIDAWYRHWIADGLAKLEAELPGGKGTFSHGESPTMADCCLVPQIFNAQRYNCELAPYPRTMRVFEQCMKLEAFDTAQPAKQPDAE